MYGYDEDKMRKRNSDIVPFNSKVNIKDFDFCINMAFDGPEQFKDVLREYASSGGYPVYLSRNTDKEIQVKCNKEKVILSTVPPKYKYLPKCPWKIWVSFMQNEKTFVVKTYKNVHTCTSHRRLGIVRSKWLETKYGEKVRANPFMKVTQLQDEIMKDLGVEVTYTQCYRVKRMALTEAEKSLWGHYAILWRYAREVYRANPGSTYYIMTEDRENMTGPRFKRLCVCFDAVKKGWKSGCRPIIGVDGCFLKTFCTGELLSAVGRDGNDQMYPIAWAAVEVENKETWLWFLTHLIEDLGLNDGQGLTLMSDKQKGLIEAVKQLLPYSEHRHCARHIYANFRDKFPGKIYKKLFWTAAKATTLAMKEIRKLSENAYIELEQKQDPHSWSRCFFKTDCKCDVVDNNMPEAFNSWILKSRYKPLLFMLEDIRRQVMVRLQKNRDLMLKNELKFGKRILIV